MKMSGVFKSEVLVDESMIYTLKDTTFMGTRCKENDVYAFVYKHSLGPSEVGAAAVAHAINCHDELVESLEKSIKLILGWHQDSENVPSHLDLQPVEEVLAKAKG